MNPRVLYHITLLCLVYISHRLQGSLTYGFITSTPKPGWNMVDVVGYLSDGSVPCKFDTDVNAPALAEYMVRTKYVHTYILLYSRTYHMISMIIFGETPSFFFFFIMSYTLYMTPLKFGNAYICTLSMCVPVLCGTYGT